MTSDSDKEMARNNGFDWGIVEGSKNKVGVFNRIGLDFDRRKMTMVVSVENSVTERREVGGRLHTKTDLASFTMSASQLRELRDLLVAAELGDD